MKKYSKKLWIKYQKRADETMREWNSDYLYCLTDDTGILQHSKYTIPDPHHGYTTDDNARALLLIVLLMEKYPHENYKKLLYRYTSFLLNAQNPQGKFRNFMSYDRQWQEAEGSEDCQGRCIWAIGTAMGAAVVPEGVRSALGSMLKAAYLQLTALKSLRAMGYAAIGLFAVDDYRVQEIAINLSRSLLEYFKGASDCDWDWFEPILTYDNSILSWSLLAAYEVTKEQDFLLAAERSLDFLMEKTFNADYFQPIGCNGWIKKGGPGAKFDQQPIEACTMILALQEAFRITKKRMYLDKAILCYTWYEGNNSEGYCLIDQVTGGCYDGIKQNGVNGNMGAESQISYGIAHFTMRNLCEL